jgi:hypothetical protein
MAQIASCRINFKYARVSRYAAFGRIDLIRLANGKIERLRLHQESIRDKVLKVTDLKHLAELYSQHG